MSPDDAIRALRRQLAAEIVRSLGEDSQHDISRHFGIPQPRMSELNRGVVDRCTVEWLIRRVYRLGGTVGLVVKLGDARREWVQAASRRMRARRKTDG
jgi:predicted XRE-type DNA-binding protein